MMSLGERVAVLKQLHPGSKITWIDKGQSNHIAKVDDEFIYKFPLRDEWFSLLCKEYEIYNLLANNVSLRIPMALELNKPNHYLKLKMLKGETISSKEAVSLDCRQKKDFSAKVALFIKEINNPSLKKGFDTIFINDNNDYYYIEKWLEYVAESSKLINGDVARRYVDQYNCFRERLGFGFSKDNLIAHKDLHEDNLIFNTQRELVGIIDFAELRYTSIHSELRTLLRFGIDTLTDIIGQIGELARGITVEDVVIFAKTYEMAIIVQDAYLKKELPWRVEQAKFFVQLWS